MSLSLNNLPPEKGSTHKKKRVGRGPGTGLGKTSGRGEKGQKSRSSNPNETSVLSRRARKFCQVRSQARVPRVSSYASNLFPGGDCLSLVTSMLPKTYSFSICHLTFFIGHSIEVWSAHAGSEMANENVK